MQLLVFENLVVYTLALLVFGENETVIHNNSSNKEGNRRNKESSRSMDNNNHIEENMESLYHTLTPVMKLAKKFQRKLSWNKFVQPFLRRLFIFLYNLKCLSPFFLQLFISEQAPGGVPYNHYTL
ncbi:hypothetical protein LOAG_15671 [Loa loa]|uniref:Uncharacterized protein n=1 Tax=Loa loa TaxID=7209 RepID=A0A1S0TFN2_LOALO|nr:hypothetical protein LOAG_15671 [Loa loa]EFO12861.1 hypothetical protein LOAG_15671 [Loa loa]